MLQLVTVRWSTGNGVSVGISKRKGTEVLPIENVKILLPFSIAMTLKLFLFCHIKKFGIF